MEPIIQGEVDLETALTRMGPTATSFMMNGDKLSAVAGGFRSGKSVAACAFEIMLGKELPGTRHLIGRLNMPALKQTTLKTFLGMFPLDWLAPNGWKEGDSRLINRWGSEYLFRHLDVTDAAVEGWMRSLNLTSFLIDQAEEVSEGVFLTLVGRLSQPNAPRHFGRLVLNPAGQDWIWQRFFDPKRPDLWLKNSGFTIPTAENEHNLPQGYIDQLRATYPADWYERFVMGSFADFSDKVYSDFDMRTHVYDDTQEWEVFNGRTVPPEDWPVIVGLDFGGIDPWAFVFISVDPVTGFLYQFGEIYLAGILGRQFADRYFDMMGTRALEGLAYDYENTQMAYEMADFGVTGVPAVKDIIPGVMKVGQYLHPDLNLASPFTGLHPSPRFFIAASCTNTIKEHVGWKWARDRRGQQTGQPADRDNHTCDAVRYAIHTFRPEPKDIPPPKRSENPALDMLSRLYWRDIEKDEERAARSHKTFYSYGKMQIF